MDVLIEKVPTIRKIILFGSYSRKKPHFGSDVDLLFVVKNQGKNEFEVIYETLYDFSLEFEWAPLVITETRFQELKKEHNSFLREICSNGIVLYDEEG